MLGRIQNHDSRIWINCYQKHPQCRLNFEANGGPTQDDIYMWLCAVKPGDYAMPNEERRDLAREHMKLAKDKWSAAARKKHRG